MVGLECRRADAAGQELEPVPTPAFRTVYGIAKRFRVEQLQGIEVAIGATNTAVVDLLPVVRRTSLLKVATIDGDATHIGVFGRSKEKAVHAYTGALTLRAHIGHWAEARVPLAGELMGGTEDPRANCIELLERSIASQPIEVEKLRTRWDAGYFAADVVAASVKHGFEFAMGVKCTAKVMAAAAGLGRYTWTPAVGMEDTVVAVIDYLPGLWPQNTNIACIALAGPRPGRSDLHRAGPRPGRSDLRRAGPQAPRHGKNQLSLALEGRIDEACAYSFISTNLDVSDEEEQAKVAWWCRHRTDIEELNRSAKHGTALRHLPPSHAVNSVWMWAGLLGCAISAWLPEITGLDHGHGRGHPIVARLRRKLITVPARITRRAGTIFLRPPPGLNLLTTVLRKLQELPSPRPGQAPHHPNQPHEKDHPNHGTDPGLMASWKLSTCMQPALGVGANDPSGRCRGGVRVPERCCPLRVQHGGAPAGPIRR